MTLMQLIAIKYLNHLTALIVTRYVTLYIDNCVFTEQIVFSGEESGESQQGGTQAASQ